MENIYKNTIIVNIIQDLKTLPKEKLNSLDSNKIKKVAESIYNMATANIKKKNPDYSNEKIQGRLLGEIIKGTLLTELKTNPSAIETHIKNAS